MDTATGDIRAVEFTSSRDGDSPVLPDLLDQIPPDEQIGTVIGDGAFDTRRCHTAILDRGGTAVIPIRECAVSNPSVNGSPLETRTDKPPKSTSASHS